MALRSILTEGHPILRQRAKRVSRIDKSLQRLADDMLETMRDAPGIGLAAPQVGVPLRLIVVEHEDEEQRKETYVLFNPEIVRGRGEAVDDEGCLSLPQWYGPVKRSEQVTVKGRNRAGKSVRLKLAGLLARAVQHEIDHLDGILFVDRVEDRAKLRRVEPEDAASAPSSGPAADAPPQGDQETSDDSPQALLTGTRSAAS